MGFLSTKWIVASACIAALLLRRDPFAVALVLGGALSGVSAKVLKHIIAEQRPTHVQPDPGMPSSHATNLFFLSVLLSQSWSEGVTGLPFGLGASWKLVVVICTPACALAAACLRVSSGHHTQEQIAAGALLGTVCAVCYFYLLLPVVMSKTDQLFNRVGETGKLVLLLGLSLLGLLVLGPLNERLKEMYRRSSKTPASKLRG
jgi:membrane-associated phospholipid phosphatase